MSSATYFISDLHLSPNTPKLTALLKQLLSDWEKDAEALYILGDLFEAWAGDDQMDNPFVEEVVTLLKNASQHYKIYFIHGNRDFLIGADFAAATGITLLEDNTLIDLYGQKILIAHGDALCTDDTQYQQFRNMVRNPAWQQQFLSLPIEERLAQVAEARSKSNADKKYKSVAIMDVNADAVDTLMRSNNYAVMIHGHTHRPAVHEWTLDDNACERWVLPDWSGEEGGFMRTDSSGWEMETI